MQENPEVKVQIEQWKNSDNEIVKKLYETIILKIQEPDLKYSIDYAIHKLKLLEGIITFIGLSPNNDSHIMKTIKDNEKVKTIEFYYYSEQESMDIKEFFNNKVVITKSIIEFWDIKASA